MLINDPGYWRNLAKLTLAQAQVTKDKWLRRRLREIATAYRRLSEWTALYSGSPLWNDELIYGRTRRETSHQ
jgi:hypothetical protein